MEHANTKLMLQQNEANHRFRCIQYKMSQLIIKSSLLHKITQTQLNQQRDHTDNSKSQSLNDRYDSNVLSNAKQKQSLYDQP
jgi:hypothetical protein